MSLKIVLLLIGGLVTAGGAGIAIGYWLRQVFAKAQKNSIELEVKQLLLSAREDAKQITAAAEDEAKRKIATLEGEIKEKEEKVTRAEERVFKREEQIDKKQTELDREIASVKTRIEEVKSIKERADILLTERGNALAAVGGLTKEEAKAKLFEELERENAEDMMVRVQKMEREGQEKLERKAQDIITTAIHRLGNSVASDTMATAITIPNDDIKAKSSAKRAVTSRPSSVQRALRSLSMTPRARLSSLPTTLSAAPLRAWPWRTL